MANSDMFREPPGRRLQPWYRPDGPITLHEGGGASQPIAFQFPDLPWIGKSWEFRMWESLANIPLRFTRSEWPAFLDGLVASDTSYIFHKNFALEIDDTQDGIYAITIARPRMKRTKTWNGYWQKRLSIQLAAFDYLVANGFITALPEVAS